MFTLCALALVFQYFYKLDGVGVLEPDEPRYAAIGRAMVSNGDWITPRLWGSPWFEKPPLLYWMTAVGFKAGLGPDLADRVPIALLSLFFLAVWFLLLQEEFGFTAAAVSTATLATCAGWIAYSSLCLTDVPLAAFFSLSVAFALRVMRGGDSFLNWAGLGAAIGIAALAKGFVPLVLAIPLLWFLKGRWRRWWIALFALLVVAGPWYVLVVYRNGAAFIQVFFWQQQFSRLYSNALQHVKPAYFYIPVLLGAVFPWTPLLLLLKPSLARPLMRNDRRIACLIAIVLFGFLFFSFSLNKLPGYVLPLLPALLAVVGVAAARSEAYRRRSFLVGCAALVAVTPLAGRLIPFLLTSRLDSPAALVSEVLPITLTMLVLFLTPLVVASFANRVWAAILVWLCLVVALIDIKSSVYPILDEQASPRGFWHEIAGESDQVCDAGLHRAWEYGLAYYRGKPIPFCDQSPRPIHLVQSGEHRAQRSINGTVVP